MKLSMWMILNRLQDMPGMTWQIADDSPQRLNSARLAYAPDCVYVRPLPVPRDACAAAGAAAGFGSETGAFCASAHPGDESFRYLSQAAVSGLSPYADARQAGVIFESGKDRIILPETGFKEGFEILQGIFDSFQDWESHTREAVRKGDYQEAIDGSWMFFGNPMSLADANKKILAMSSRQDPALMDSEWRYMRKFGYASLRSVRLIHFDNSQLDFTHYGEQAFSFRPNQIMEYGGLSYNMQFGHRECGRLTLLARNRPLNPGDRQLLRQLCEILEPALGTLPASGSDAFSIFYDLLEGKPCEEEKLRIQMKYLGWKENDQYEIVLLCPRMDKTAGAVLQAGPVPREAFDALSDTLIRTISMRMEDCVVLKVREGTAVLGNRDLYRTAAFHELLREILPPQEMCAGFSLPLTGLHHFPEQYKQACHAAAFCPADSPVSYFAGHGIEYLLSGASSPEKKLAVHPAVRHLWELKQARGDECFDTLLSWLDHEKSISQTAAALHTHRNTVQYRIRKCEALLGNDLDGGRSRAYIQMSCYLLEAPDEPS